MKNIVLAGDSDGLGRKFAKKCLEKYNSNDLIEFYIQNGLEFDEEKGYFGENIKSFALMQNSRIIGAVSISIYKNKSFIEALAVDKEYRNKGIGKYY